MMQTLSNETIDIGIRLQNTKLTGKNRRPTQMMAGPHPMSNQIIDTGIRVQNITVTGKTHKPSRMLPRSMQTLSSERIGIRTRL